MLKDMAIPERTSDEELSRLVAHLARVFIQRWDCYPQQLSDGRYVCMKKPLTTSLLIDHLAGKLTLGTYLLNRRSEAKFIVLDADDDAHFSLLSQATAKLAGEGAPGYLEKSRRGGHLWLFFAHTISGRDARAFGKGIIQTYELGRVELYPKQDKLTSGPGSLIRLPFGVHQKSGKRYGFMTPDSEPLSTTIHEQIKSLSRPRVVSEAAFEAYQSVSSRSIEPKALKVSVSNAETVSMRIKESVSVLEFVSQYIDLDERGMGHCPFHDDEHPSFGVNDKRNYWHCFAGCGGGSVIDFWAKWRERQGEEAGFVSTISELVDMLFD